MASWERFARSTPRGNEKERYSAVFFLRKKMEMIYITLYWKYLKNVVL